MIFAKNDYNKVFQNERHPPKKLAKIAENLDHNIGP
jgi:hypothetical protein